MALENKRAARAGAPIYCGAEQVGTVFRPEVETGDDGENDPDELVAPRQGVVLVVPVRVIVRFILFDLLDGDRPPKEAGP